MKIPSNVQKQRILTILYSQFPSLSPQDWQKILGDTKIQISRKTGRIKSIRDGEILLFSLRTSDGRLLPSFVAAERLLECNYIENQVEVTEEAAPFIARGKSAFCKYVIRATLSIQPEREVFVMDPKGKLLAVGSAVQPGYAMVELNSGVAVKIKHYKK